MIKAQAPRAPWAPFTKKGKKAQPEPHQLPVNEGVKHIRTFQSIVSLLNSSKQRETGDPLSISIDQQITATNRYKSVDS